MECEVFSNFVGNVLTYARIDERILSIELEIQ